MFVALAKMVRSTDPAVIMGYASTSEIQRWDLLWQSALNGLTWRRSAQATTLRVLTPIAA